MFAYDLAFGVLILVCVYLIVHTWRTGEDLRHLADTVAILEIKVWAMQELAGRGEMEMQMLPREVPHGEA
jgi:hypothetical protein